MKILRIVYDWPPPWDGLAPHPYEVTVAQQKIGHDITVFAGRWPRAGDLEVPEGVSVVPFFREPLPHTMFFTSSLLVFFYYMYWRFSNRPDVIHMHGQFGAWLLFYRKFLSVVMKNSRELKIPLVLHFHNTVAGREASLIEKGEQIKPISKNFSWPIQKYIDKLGVKMANALIFVGEENKEDAQKYYNAVPEKCVVVETGVNTDLFVQIDPIEKERTRKDISLDYNDKVILNHGMMVERKNIHLLVESLAHLPPYYKLFLAGPFVDGDYEYRVKKMIQDKGLYDRVVMSGYTPYPETPIAYQAADIFVLPSKFEGLPKVVMQGLSCGIPCLVSGFTVSEEISGLYYIRDMSPQAIANQIKDICEEAPHVDRSKVHDIYSWNQRVKIIEDIYANL